MSSNADMTSELRYAAFVVAVQGLIGAWEEQLDAGERLRLEELMEELGGVSEIYGVDAWLDSEGVNLERQGRIEVLEVGKRAAELLKTSDSDDANDEDDMLEILDDSDYEERWV
jgi:hypothetical protein